ncbi:MAG: ankyrin repeat domain-containing protein [Candidatus Xenobiia bacterium LiM19]
MKKCSSCTETVEDSVVQCPQCGAKVDGADETDIFDIVEDGDIEALQELIKKGANIMERGHENWTPLHLAASEGYFEIAELLLKEGVDASARDNDDWTPLHLASQECDPELAKLLISHGADTSIKNSDGQTPLDIASEYYNKFNVLIGLLSGAEIDEDISAEELQQDVVKVCSECNKENDVDSSFCSRCGRKLE